MTFDPPPGIALYRGRVATVSCHRGIVGAEAALDASGSAMVVGETDGWRDVIRGQRVADTNPSTELRDDFAQALRFERTHTGERASGDRTGYVLAKVLPQGYPRNTRPGGIRCWQFPPLAECRIFFEQIARTSIPRPDVERSQRKIPPPQYQPSNLDKAWPTRLVDICARNCCLNPTWPTYPTLWEGNFPDSGRPRFSL